MVMNGAHKYYNQKWRIRVTTMNNYIFTSESVSEGHPDKVADQISDALVDAGFKVGDETTRVAIETLVTTNMVTVAGEVKNFNVTTDEVEQIIRDTVRRIGYEQEGFKLKMWIHHVVQQRREELKIVRRGCSLWTMLIEN